MQRSRFQRTMRFLAFSFAVGLGAFFLGGTVTLAVNGLRESHPSQTAKSMQSNLEGGNTCVIYRFVAI